MENLKKALEAKELRQALAKSRLNELTMEKAGAEEALREKQARADKRAETKREEAEKTKQRLAQKAEAERLTVPLRHI